MVKYTISNARIAYWHGEPALEIFVRLPDVSEGAMQSYSGKVAFGLKAPEKDEDVGVQVPQLFVKMDGVDGILAINHTDKETARTWEWIDKAKKTGYFRLFETPIVGNKILARSTMQIINTNTPEAYFAFKMAWEHFIAYFSKKYNVRLDWKSYDEAVKEGIIPNEKGNEKIQESDGETIS